MTLAEIAKISGGELEGRVGARRVESFSTDSRTLFSGAMFVAVHGTRDGHDFVAAAAERGAAAALVERVPDGLAVDIPLVVVDDTVQALRRLADGARERLAHARVVAVTGSTGKTSTKDLTAAALATTFEVRSSPASFNNELGVPLTLLGAEESTEAVVVEIGARGPGQITDLARVVRHQVGIVTTVGAAHTELFGSVEEVARAKGELLEALPADGVAVVGTDHDWVDALAARTEANVVTVGRERSADVRVSALEVDGLLRPSFTLETPWGSAPVTLEVRGAHQAVNAALAATAALSLGVDLDVVAAGLARTPGSQWRMDVERSPAGFVVINDAYNANPASMTAALEALRAIEVPGRRWAVVGEMAELGDVAELEHRQLGRRAAEVGIDELVVVGEAARGVLEGARGAGLEARWAPDPGAALEVLADLTSDDAVLVKASRAVGLEHLAHALLRQPDDETIPVLTDSDVVGERPR